MNKLFFLIGASGSGKTTAIKELEKEAQDIFVLHFDSIGVPSFETMIKEFGSIDEWQRVKTLEWTKRVAKEYLHQKNVILDSQTRPSFIEEACEKAGVTNFSVILFDCTDEERRNRQCNQRE